MPNHDGSADKYVKEKVGYEYFIFFLEQNALIVFIYLT